MQQNKIRLILLLFISLSPIVVEAQNDLSKPEAIFLVKQLQNDSTATLNISLSGGYSINTNNVSSKQLSNFMYANAVSEGDKQNVLSALSSSNLIGYGGDQGITARYKQSQKRYFIAGLYNKNMISVDFKKSLAALALNGNKMFAGAEVVLGPFNYTNLMYQQVYLGVEQKIGKGYLGIGFSGLNGIKLNQLNLKRANLYTEMDGAYIDFDTDVDFNYSNKQSNFNGYGFSTSWSYNYLGEKNNLVVNVSDFGFIKWQNLSTYNTNQKYHFEGIGITDIFNFSESAFSDVNLSNVQSVLGISPEQKDKIVATPTTLSIDYLHSIGKLGLGAGAKHILFINYIPKVYLRTSYALNNFWWGALTVSHGGFGGFDYEVALGGKIIDQTFFSINMHYAEWLIVPNQTAGQGIDVVVSRFF